MKTLYLIRHAKSSWEDRDLSDFERPLNERGLRDAPVIAKILKKKNISPGLIISSPAYRALETARIFAGALSYDPEKIVTDERIYEATMHELFSLVRGIPDSYQAVMLFAHNPGISNFANLLSNRFVPEMPTCAVAGLSFDQNSWNEIERNCGELVVFEFPSKSKK
jgi:phosphohistidine phosphatase